MYGIPMNVNASLPPTGRIPILTAVPGKSAFQVASEFADGALSWVCPVAYLIQGGIPAPAGPAPRPTDRPVSQWDFPCQVFLSSRLIPATAIPNQSRKEVVLDTGLKG